MAVEGDSGPQALLARDGADKRQDVARVGHDAWRATSRRGISRCLLRRGAGCSVDVPDQTRVRPSP